MNCTVQLGSKKTKLALIVLMMSLFSNAQASIIVPNPWTPQKNEAIGSFYMGLNQVSKDLLYRMPVGANIELGLFDQAALAINYDKSLSMALQAKILEEGLYSPQVSFGIRNVFSSPEQEWFSTDANFEGEFFITMGKEFSDWIWVWLGYSHFPKLNIKSDQSFWGLELKSNFGLGMTYEAFSRFNEYHHLLGLKMHFSEAFNVEIGMLELQEWFYQEGVLGFYQNSEVVSDEGYLFPGVYLKVSFKGGFNNSGKLTRKEQIEELQKETRLLKSENDLLKARFERTEKALAKWIGPSVEINEELEVKSLKLLDRIVDSYQRGSPVENIIILQDSLVANGVATERILQRLVDNNITEEVYKTTSIRIMGYTKSKVYTASLIQALGDSRSQIRRESLLALDRIDDVAAQEPIGRLRDDKEELVKLIATQLYEKYKAKYSMPSEDAALEIQKQAPEISPKN